MTFHTEKRYNNFCDTRVSNSKSSLLIELFFPISFDEIVLNISCNNPNNILDNECYIIGEFCNPKLSNKNNCFKGKEKINKSNLDNEFNLNFDFSYINKKNMQFRYFFITLSNTKKLKLNMISIYRNRNE